LSKIEKTINQKIKENLPVTHKEMPYQEAIKSGVLAFFKQKYPSKVTVYSIGEYSKELCGGPHVTNTGQIGKIKIDKQKALGQGLRRIYLKFIQSTKK
jgi:alanyl-tRNA synthetase